jgi:hypothetical protein
MMMMRSVQYVMSESVLHILSYNFNIDIKKRKNSGQKFPPPTSCTYCGIRETFAPVVHHLLRFH